MIAGFAVLFICSPENANMLSFLIFVKSSVCPVVGSYTIIIHRSFLVTACSFSRFHSLEPFLLALDLRLAMLLSPDQIDNIRQSKWKVICHSPCQLFIINIQLDCQSSPSSPLVFAHKRSPHPNNRIAKMDCRAVASFSIIVRLWTGIPDEYRIDHHPRIRCK